MFKQLLAELRVPLAIALLVATLLVWALEAQLQTLPQFWWAPPATLSLVMLAKPLFEREPRFRRERLNSGGVRFVERSPAGFDSAGAAAWGEEASLSREDEAPPPLRLRPPSEFATRDWCPSGDLVHVEEFKS